MKTAVVVAAVCASLVAISDAASQKTQPGWCKDDKDCQKENKDYVCVSVQTTRQGTEQVKQCLPFKAEGDICSGTTPGLCPSFSTWPREYKSISSVCSYIFPEVKCIGAENTNSESSAARMLQEDETSSGSEASTTSKKKTAKGVACLNVRDEQTEKDVGVIYGCVDFDGRKLLFKEGSKAENLARKLNYTAIINEKCVNPKNEPGSDVVCSGRGTCAPTGKGNMDYQCKCNVGYSGRLCQKIDSNKCTMRAQCAAGTCDLATQQCVCEKGTTGFQCSECDPTSEDACNKHGKCAVASGSTNATCTCEAGWSGAQCDRRANGLKKSGSADAATDDGSAQADGSSSASTLSSAIAVAVSSVLVIATMF